MAFRSPLHHVPFLLHLCQSLVYLTASSDSLVISPGLPPSILVPNPEHLLAKPLSGVFIRGASRLLRTNWHAQLGLNRDGSAEGELVGYQTWLYLTISSTCPAGIAPSHLGPSAQESITRTPAHDSFDRAFETVIQEHMKSKYVSFHYVVYGTTQSYLDDLPFAREKPDHGPTLVLMSLTPPCVYNISHVYHWRCSVVYTTASLPLQRMPWNRQIRVLLRRKEGASVVVPAFPGAPEQMRSLILQMGPWNSGQMVEKVEGVSWTGVRPRVDGGVDFLNDFDEVNKRCEGFATCSSN